MRFAELVDVYTKVEATSKRLEMRKLLAELIRGLQGEELGHVLYLSQGLLAPEYEGIELGMADSLARRAVATAVDVPEKEVAASVTRTGDLGTTAEELVAAHPTPGGAHLSVSDVYRDLYRIATSAGEGSQEAKINLLVELLGRCSPVEARYLVRFVLGRLRLGVREMTILDALAERFADSAKDARARIEAAFNVCSDLAMVAAALEKSGLDGLASIELTPGRPIRPMLAERSPDLADVLERMGGRAGLEYKYDGLRVQAHVPKTGPATLFSRRLENITSQFPELSRGLPEALKQRPAIVEGECVSIDLDTDEIRPFQEVSRRRGRKYDLERMQAEIPVSLFLFDLLLDAEGPTMDLPLPDRRARLTKLLGRHERIRLAEQKVVDSVDDAQTFFDASIAAGCEGVMAKSLAPESKYRAGARGFWWIKYKREYTIGLADSIDGVVVGAFHGRGRRAGLYGALLMAVYDPEADRFATFCKVGSGFDDEELAKLPERLKPYEVTERPASVDTGLAPDRWFRPGLVLEIRGAELSLSPNHRAAFGKIRPGVGFALRFPRFTGRYRDDKEPTDTTNTDELVGLYKAQVKQASAVESEEAA